MAVFGPRLDQPTAVGDEGRPRAASLATASVALVAFTAALAYFGGLWGVLRTVVTGAALAGAGIAMLDRDTFNGLAIGHLTFTFGGLILVGGIVSALTVPPDTETGLALGVLATGTALAWLGMAAGWANAARGATLTRAVKQGWGAAVVPFVVVIVLSTISGVGLLVWSGFFQPVLFPSGSLALSTLFLTVAIATGGLYVAIARLPLASLVARSRRPAFETLLDGWQRATKWLTVGAVLGWIAFGLVEVFAGGILASLPRPTVAVVGRTASPWLRVPIALVGVLAVAAVVVTWLVRKVTDTYDATSRRRLAPVFGGLILLAIPLPLLTALLYSLRRSPRVSVGTVIGLAAVAFMLLLIALVVFLVLVTFLPAAVRVGLVPEEAGAPAFASAGLLLATVGGGAAGVQAPLVFAGTAAALLVWDVSAFGQGLTAELGRVPDTRRLELLHGILSGVVAVGAVLVVTGLYYLFTAFGPSGDVVLAAVVAVVGVLVLLVPPRD
jgi:hypothetical protein